MNTTNKVYDVSKEFAPTTTHIMHGGDPSVNHPRKRRGKTQRKRQWQRAVESSK